MCDCEHESLRGGWREDGGGEGGQLVFGGEKRRERKRRKDAHWLADQVEAYVVGALTSTHFRRKRGVVAALVRHIVLIALDQGNSPLCE